MAASIRLLIVSFETGLSENDLIERLDWMAVSRSIQCFLCCLLFCILYFAFAGGYLLIIIIDGLHFTE